MTGIAVKSTMSSYIWVAFFISLLTERVFSQLDGNPACFLDDYPTAENFSTEKLLGVWYARKINMNTPLHARPTMLEVYEGQGDLLHLRMLLRMLQSDGDCVVVQSIASPSCGAGIGEFHMTRPADVPTGDWINLKVIYLTDTVLAIFECGKENVDGTCDESGRNGFIWTREPNEPITQFGDLMQLYRGLCLDITNWETTPHNDCDEALLLDKPKYVDSRGPECQAMNIPAVPNFDYSRALGLWYGIAFVVDPSMAPQSFVDFDVNGAWVGSSNFTTGGLNADGKCEINPYGNGYERPRCPTNPDYGYMVYIGPKIFEPSRALYADYDTAVVYYACSGVDQGGHCLPNKEVVYVFSRQPTLEQGVLDNIKDIIESKACVDPSRLVEIDQTVDCSSLFEE
ncbi:hypothetical protein ScPMuIL_016595 [Solemya velum]